MSKEDQLKEAAKQAENAWNDAKQAKEVEKIKELVKHYLEKIEEVDEKIRKLNEERKLLKLDLEDLKQGRLDKIEERQKVDEKAREYSLIKVKVVTYPTINLPQTIPNPIWYTKPWTRPYEIMCTWNSSSGIGLSGHATSGSFNATGSDMKYYTTGAYQTNFGVVNI